MSNYVEISPEGFSGELWLLWTNKPTFQLEIIHTSNLLFSKYITNLKCFVARNLHLWVSTTESLEKTLETINRIVYY